jgi:hypothetical protein
MQIHRQIEGKGFSDRNPKELLQLLLKKEILFPLKSFSDRNPKKSLQLLQLGTNKRRFLFQ